MSQFTDNLTARREQLGLTVPQVHQELNRRGVDVAFSTVAGWFNGSRGGRWKVEELKELLDVLQTNLEEMAGGDVELVDEPLPAAIAREVRSLSPVQQQSLLAMVKAMKPS